MKTFIKKTLIYIFILFIVLVILDLMSMVEPTRTLLAELTGSKEFISINVGADEIKPYIEKAGTPDGATTLILGDSVCHQLFRDLEDKMPGISIIGSNAAVTPAGQYILAKRFIDSHPDATDIYLFMLPAALGQSFDTNYGYQYTVMPFVETGTINMLDDDTIKQMGDVYGKFFMTPSIVRMIDLSGPNRKLYLNMLKKYSSAYKPDKYFDIADNYIGKIKSLCDENNITLHLHPCPVFETGRENNEDLKSSYKDSKLYGWFPDYFDEMVYYPDDQTDDKVHFSPEYSDLEYRISVIEKCYSSLISIENDRLQFD